MARDGMEGRGFRGPVRLKRSRPLGERVLANSNDVLGVLGRGMGFVMNELSRPPGVPVRGLDQVAEGDCGHVIATGLSFVFTVEKQAGAAG